MISLQQELNTSPVLRLDSVWFPVLPGISLEGESWEPRVHGRDWEASCAWLGRQQGPKEPTACLRADRGRAAALCPGWLPRVWLHPRETCPWHPRAPPGPRDGWRETSPVRNTFSLALWKRSWDWEVIAVLGKVQLLCPRYHSQWLPYGVTAQWSRKCLRPNPAIPKEEDDALANVSRRLNGLSRGTIRKLTMPRVPQLSTFRKCLLQVRHPNATGLTGHQGAAYTTTSQL